MKIAATLITLSTIPLIIWIEKANDKVGWLAVGMMITGILIAIWS